MAVLQKSVERPGRGAQLGPKPISTQVRPAAQTGALGSQGSLEQGWPTVAGVTQRSRQTLTSPGPQPAAPHAGGEGSHWAPISPGLSSASKAANRSRARAVFRASLSLCLSRLHDDPRPIRCRARSTVSVADSTVSVADSERQAVETRTGAKPN